MTATLPDAEPTAGDTPRATSAAEGLPPLPWRELVRWALLGLLGVLCFIAVDVARYGGSNPVSLIQPGTEGPSIAVIEQDFPLVEPPAGLGLDGQQYYAMARQPMHMTEVAPDLDRPRYRFQRPVLPWLAWAMHPTGGGVGLIWALFAAGVVCVFAGALATGALGVTLGGKPWLAAVLPVLPGTFWSLRVTVSDAPALGLAMVALALSARRRPVLAVAVGALAVLAKEPVVLLFAGWALASVDWRARRADMGRVLLTVVPAAVAAGWMLYLRVALPDQSETVNEVTLPPFGGLVKAASTLWSQGDEWVGMVSSVVALALGALVLLRRRGHALWWIVAVHVAFASIMSSNVIGMNFGGTRSNQALLLIAIVALATPTSTTTPTAPTTPTTPELAR